MKTLKKIISALVIVCFLGSNVLYADAGNSFTLAAPSKFTRLEGPEFKEAAQVAIGARAALKELGSFTLNNLRQLGTREIIENSVFSKKITGEINFNQAAEVQISSGHVLIESGNYIIKATTGQGVYYCLISEGETTKKFNVTVVSERVLKLALKDGTVKFTHESLAEEDRGIIDTYIEHEGTPENNEAVDPYIRRKMENGDYAVNYLTAESLLYRGGGKRFDPVNVQQLITHADEFLGTIGVDEASRSGIIAKLQTTPLILIPYNSEKELPTVTIGEEKIKVKAHSSEFATYIFVPSGYFHRMTWAWGRHLSDLVYRRFVHEIGARCGLTVKVEEKEAGTPNKEVVNILDGYYDIIGSDLRAGQDYQQDELAKAITTDGSADVLKSLRPVNLLNLELRNDYAAGNIKKRKSIFKRVVALVVTGVVAAGSTAYYFMRPEKAEVPVPEATQKESDQTKEEVVSTAPSAPVKPKERPATEEELAEIQRCLEALKNKNETIRNAAIHALGELSTKAAVPILIEMLEDESTTIWTRRYAIDALGKIGDKRATPVLVEMLQAEKSWFNIPIKVPNDSDTVYYQTKHSIAMALGEIGDKRAVDPLINILKERFFAYSVHGAHPVYLDGAVAHAIIEIEKKTGESMVDPLIDALKNGHPKIRQGVAYTLGRLGNKEAVPALINALADQDADVRETVVVALGKLDDKRASIPLIVVLKDKIFGVRLRATEVLGDFGTKEAVPALIEVLKDEEWIVRGSAAGSLGQIGDKKAAQFLYELLEDKHSFPRINAAKALGLIGNKDALPKLKEVAEKDKYKIIRETAQEAIKKIEKAQQEAAKKIEETKPVKPKERPATEEELAEMQRCLEALKKDDTPYYAMNFFRELAIKGVALPELKKRAIPALEEFCERERLSSMYSLSISEAPGYARDTIQIIRQAPQPSEEIHRILANLGEAIRQLKQKGMCYHAILDIKYVALNFNSRYKGTHLAECQPDYIKDSDLYERTVLPELKGKAVPALKKLLNNKEYKSVHDDIEETLQIIERGADGHFTSLAQKGELTKKIDTLINSKLNHLFSTEIHDGSIMLVSIGKPAIPALATALLPNSDFIKIGKGHVAGPQAHGEARVVLMASTIRARALRVINTIVSSCEDIDDRGLVPSLVMAGDVDSDNLKNVEKILELLSKKSKVKEDATEALKRNEPGHVSTKRIQTLIAILKNADIERDRDVISSVAAAIGRIGPQAKSAVPALIRVLERNKYERKNNFRFDEVNNYAISALGRMGPLAKDAVPILLDKLVESLEAHNFGDSDYYRTSEKTIEALQKIGVESVPAKVSSRLKELSDKGKSVYVRKTAKEAIEKILAAQPSIKPAPKVLPAPQSDTDNRNKKKEISDLVGELGSHNDNIRWAAEKALINIGKPAVPALVEALKDRNIAVSEGAAETLVEIGQPAVDPLIKALSDEAWFVRESAAKALGKTGDIRTLKPLKNALKDEEYYVRKAAQAAIEKIEKGQEKATKKREEVKPVKLKKRPATEEELAKMQTYLEALEKGEPWSIRIDAAKALGEIGDPRAIPALIQTLKNKSHSLYSDVREAAAEALGEIGDPRAIPALIEALKSPHSSTRQAAAEALGEIGDKQAIPALVKMLNDKDVKVRLEAANVLGKLDDKRGLPILIEALKYPKNRIQLFAIVALGELGDKRAVPALIEVLKDAYNDNLKSHTVRSLGELGDKRAIPALIEVLTDRNLDVREATEEALAKIGKPAVDPLIKALNDKDEDVHNCAAIALGLMGNRKAVDPLIKALSDEAWFVRNRAAIALGKIGDTRALEPLKNTLMDEDEYVREAAQEAIERIKKAQESDTIDKESMLYEKEAISGLARINEPMQATEVARRTDEITEVLWQQGCGEISKDEAEAELAMLAPNVASEDYDRGAIYQAWMAYAATIMVFLGLTVSGEHQKPEDIDIHAVAAIIKDKEAEVFMLESQFPKNMTRSFRNTLQNIFGDRLRTYQKLDDLNKMVKHPEKSIIMTVGLKGNQINVLKNTGIDLQLARFMNFGPVNIEEMTQTEHENYIAETLSILLAARALTPEDAQDQGSPMYQMLAHLLESHMADANEVDTYIRTIADGSIDPIKKLRYLLKTILRAVPITVYRIMKPAVQVLWSA